MMKNSDTSPCLRCKDRWVNETGRCHTTCERYANFKEYVKQRNDQINVGRSNLSDPLRRNKTAAQLNYIKKMKQKNR